MERTQLESCGLSAVNRLIVADKGVQLEYGILFQSGFCLGGEGPVFAFGSWARSTRDKRSLQDHDSAYLTFVRPWGPPHQERQAGMVPLTLGHYTSEMLKAASLPPHRNRLAVHPPVAD
jgi:hypothetical protein